MKRKKYVKKGVRRVVQNRGIKKNMGQGKLSCLDWVDGGLAIWALVFAFTSFFVDSVFALGVPIQADSPNIMARWIYKYYAKDTDYLLMHMPLFLRIQTWFSAFVFGPFYSVLCLGLLKKWEWIRIPSFVYAGVMGYGMTIVFGVELFGAYPPGNYVRFFSGTLPYALFPMALFWRMLYWQKAHD
jgi:hypothetical protein